MKKHLLDPLVVLFLVLGSLLFVSMHVAGYTKLSPIDELQHIDYVDRVPETPALADKVGQEAMRAQACRTVDSPGFVSPPCGLETYDPLAFQERGYNTAALNPPVYYLATRVVGEAIIAVTPADDLVAGARLAGALWLALGLVLTFGVARARGATTVGAGAVCVLLLAAPAMVFASSTVNPDSFAFLWGAVLLALLTWWERAPSVRRAAPLVLAAGVATGVKFTFLMAPAAIAAYLVLRLLSERSAAPAEEAPLDGATRTAPLERRRGIAVSLSVVALPLLVAMTWLQVQGARPQQDPADPPTMSAAFATPSFPWLQLYDNLFVFVTPLSSPWWNVGTPQLTNVVTTLVSIALLGGVLAALLTRAQPSTNRLLAAGALLSAVAFGVGLVIVNYVTMKSYFPLPPRYGGTLVPIMAVVAATALRDRAAQLTMAGAAVAALVVSAWRVAGFA